MIRNENDTLGKKEPISKKELKSKIEAKLISRGVANFSEATDEQLYQAVVHAIKDLMISYRERFKKRARAGGTKKICYL